MSTEFQKLHTKILEKAFKSRTSATARVSFALNHRLITDLEQERLMGYVLSMYPDAATKKKKKTAKAPVSTKAKTVPSKTVPSKTGHYLVFLCEDKGPVRHLRVESSESLLDVARSLILANAGDRQVTLQEGEAVVSAKAAKAISKVGSSALERLPATIMESQLVTKLVQDIGATWCTPIDVLRRWGITRALTASEIASVSQLARHIYLEENGREPRRLEHEFKPLGFGHPAEKPAYTVPVCAYDMNHDLGILMTAFFESQDRGRKQKKGYFKNDNLLANETFRADYTSVLNTTDGMPARFRKLFPKGLPGIDFEVQRALKGF